MGRTCWLSHPLDESTPAYGGGEGFERSALACIGRGDSANTSRWCFPNHLGTHVDVPKHFFDDGATVTDYEATHWVFRHPALMDVRCEAGTLVEPKHLGRVPGQCDLLLIRTGWERYRGVASYWQGNPGLSEDLARWIRRTCPTVRAVGLDCISITSRLHREQGRAAHRAFLAAEGKGAPIVLIEDLALAHVDGYMTQVVVAPLRVLGADGGPCTVLAFLAAR